MVIHFPIRYLDSKQCPEHWGKYSGLGCMSDKRSFVVESIFKDICNVWSPLYSRNLYSSLQILLYEV